MDFVSVCSPNYLHDAHIRAALRAGAVDTDAGTFTGQVVVDLAPEKGRVWYGGAVVDLNRWVRGLSFSADTFDIALRNVITSFTTPTTFFNFFPLMLILLRTKVISSAYFLIRF